jgi:xylulokinase
MPTSLLGVDIGTTSVKAVVIDKDGSLLAQASQEYPTTYPHPNWAEQNPDDWFAALRHVLGNLWTRDAIDPRSLAAMSVSCQAPTITAVDVGGRPLAPAQLWMDRRGDAECRWLADYVGEEEVARINGGRIDPYYVAPKWLWLQRHAPAIERAAHKLLFPNGFIIHKLCGEFTIDLSHGPLTLFFHSAHQIWSGDLLARMGLDEAKLPPLRPCSQVVGKVNNEAAATTGLPAGLPVVAGMTDGTAAGVEAGLVRPGDAVEMTGQSTVLLICSDRPYLGRELIPLGHAAPGLHLVVGALVASGGALRWFRDQLGEAEREQAARSGADAFDLLTRLGEQSEPGANRLIFLPYMYGERSPIWDSNARGVFCGLSLATTKGDMVRAVMEGAAYGLRHNMAAAEEAGFTARQLACVGGGARSALWNQIKANVLQRPVHLPQAATGAPMGDAIVAAVGAGIYPTIQAAVDAMVRRGAVFTPDPTWAARYNALYRIYINLYPALKETFRDLSEV